MKKLFLALLLAVFTLSTYSCRETTESETIIEENDGLDEVGEDIEDAADEVGDEMEDAANEVDSEIDVDVDENI